MKAGVQMRAFSRGSDGLAEICEDDAKNVIIPLLSDDVRDGLSEYVENLQRGTTTINSVVKQLIKDERIAYNDQINALAILLLYETKGSIHLDGAF